jgi:hypothetical protein
MAVEMIFDEEGMIHSLYHECIPLNLLGKITVERASHIEFDSQVQLWQVLTPNKNTVLYENDSRDNCLLWERRNLTVA